MLLAQQVVIEQPGSSILQQLTPLAAPVAALLGVWVGRLLDARARREETIRTAAIEAYSRFILRCHDCSRQAVDMLQARAGNDSTAHEYLRETVFPLRLAASEMQLLAPENIYERATAVARAALAVSDALSTTSGVDEARARWTQDGRWDLLDDLEAQLAAFVRGVRHELREHR